MKRKISKRSAIALTATLGVAVCIVATGCTTTIVSPASPVNPVTVAVVDYGRHASLVLPKNGASIEFEYGEWEWFALGRDRARRVFPTLFWKTQGTLGRRDLPYPPDPKILRAEKNAEEVLTFQVSAGAAENLRRRLTARYEANRETEVFNEEWDMSFVKDPVDYHGFHNSNHELAEWLKELGCEIKGSAMFARFEIKPPRGYR